MKNKKIHDYARLGLMFEKTTKELLIILNQHKTINFQLVVPVKGHGTNVSYLKPDIVINGDIWIDCKLAITSNLKETSKKYDEYARVLEFYVLISEDISYGVDERSGQVVRSIWNILEIGRNRLGEVGYERFYCEFKALEEEYYLIKNSKD